MKKIRLTIIIVLSLLAAGTVGIWAFGGTGNSFMEKYLELQPIDEEAGEYMIIGLPKDYDFEVEVRRGATVGEDDFAVVDLDNNRVQTGRESEEGVEVIKSPKGGYKKGEFYTLDLEGKGTFAEKELEKVNKLFFCVNKKETRNVEYSDKVKEVKESRVEVSDGVILVKGKYKTGDIILTDVDGDKIDEIYKLENAKRQGDYTEAEIGEAEAEEVYENIEIFYYQDVDLEDAKIDEDQFVGALEETGVLDAFLDPVYAAGKKNLRVEKELLGKDGYEITATITDPADENRQLQATFCLKDRVFASVDSKKNKVVFDNTLTLTSGLEFSVKGEDKAKTEAKIEAALEEYSVENNEDGDLERVELPLVPITIPIYGSIGVKLEMGLVAETKLAAEFHAGVYPSVTIKQGVVFDWGKLKVQKKYRNIDGDVNAELMVKGSLDAFAGAYADANLEVKTIFSAGLSASGGAYLDAKGCFIVKDIPKDVKADGYYKVESGIRLKADVTVALFKFEEDRIPLADYEKPLFEIGDYRRFKGVDLEDSYRKSEEGLFIGELNAIHENVMNGEEEFTPIDTYTLKIDGKKIEVVEGKIYEDIAEGKHTFFVEWKDNQKTQSYEKQVVVKEPVYDMAFIEEYILGKTLSEIEDKCGKAKLLSEGEYKVWYRLEKADLNFFFYPKADYNADICNGVSGTLGQIFGIKGEESISDFTQRNNILGRGYDVVGYYFDKESGRTEYDIYNSVYHWYFGYPPDTLDTKKYNVMVDIHYNGKAEYFLQILAKDTSINEESLCNIEYSFDFDYENQYRYWEGTKRL